jgi:hypothetical protein
MQSKTLTASRAGSSWPAADRCGERDDVSTARRVSDRTLSQGRADVPAHVNVGRAPQQTAKVAFTIRSRLSRIE